MKTPWYPSSPIQDLFNQMQTGQKFAKKRGEIIDDTQLVRLMCDLMEETGIFARGLIE